jgi:hypothetical protein
MRHRIVTAIEIKGDLLPGDLKSAESGDCVLPGEGRGFWASTHVKAAIGMIAERGLARSARSGLRLVSVLDLR